MDTAVTAGTLSSTLSGWDITIISLGVFHCVALAYVIIAVFLIKNGTVARVIARVKPMANKGQYLATEGKRLSLLGKEHAPQIALHVKAMTNRATLPSPEGLTIDYADLQKALATLRLASGGVAGLSLLRRKKLDKTVLAKQKQKKIYKPILAERMGLIPPIARPLVRALPTIRKILPVVIRTVKARKIK